MRNLTDYEKLLVSGGVDTDLTQLQCVYNSDGSGIICGQSLSDDGNVQITIQTTAGPMSMSGPELAMAASLAGVGAGLLAISGGTLIVAVAGVIAAGGAAAAGLGYALDWYNSHDRNPLTAQP